MRGRALIWLLVAAAMACGMAYALLMLRRPEPSHGDLQPSGPSPQVHISRNSIPAASSASKHSSVPPVGKKHEEQLANLLKLPPNEAITLMVALEQNPENSRLITDWFTEMAESSGVGLRVTGSSDFDAIVKASGLIPDGPGLQGGIKKASAKFIASDRKRALSWAQALASPELRKHAYLGFFNYLNRLPEDQQVSTINEIIADPAPIDPKLEAYLNLGGIEALLKTHPEQAGEWLLTVDDASSRAADEKFAASAEPRDVTTFIQTLYERNASDRADAALLTYVNNAAVRNPRETAEWLRKFEGDVPPSALTTIVMVWARTDRSAAEQWINENAPDGRRTELLRVAASIPVRR